MTWSDVLEIVGRVLDDRSNTTGSAGRVHATVANLWTGYYGRSFTARDVMVMMALFKIGRMEHRPENLDTYVDAIGYLALAAEEMKAP
jgi:hypothetical protein